MDSFLDLCWDGLLEVRNRPYSGFEKISLGPTNPLMALLMHIIAASVEIAADAPLESLSCFPALIALQGTSYFDLLEFDS